MRLSVSPLAGQKFVCTSPERTTHTQRPTCSQPLRSHRRCWASHFCPRSGSDKTQQTEAAPPTSQPSTSIPPPTQPAMAASSGGVSSGAGIAGGAALAAVAAFTIGRLLSAQEPSLVTLEQMAVPLEAALSNGKPTVMEFYANWCEVCQDLVADEYQVEKEYGDRVNFVMLNIENSKWAPEIADYRVKGIPHFVFLDKKGEPLAAAVGRLPRQVLEGNVEALSQDQAQLPFAAVRGQTSSMSRPDGQAPKVSAPRDHA